MSTPSMKTEPLFATNSFVIALIKATLQEFYSLCNTIN